VANLAGVAATERPADGAAPRLHPRQMSELYFLLTPVEVLALVYPRASPWVPAKDRFCFLITSFADV